DRQAVGHRIAEKGGGLAGNDGSACLAQMRYRRLEDVEEAERVLQQMFLHELGLDRAQMDERHERSGSIDDRMKAAECFGRFVDEHLDRLRLLDVEAPDGGLAAFALHEPRRKLRPRLVAEIG